MKKIIENLKKLKSLSIGLLDNHKSKISTMVVILITAFFVVTFRNLNHATEEMILMKENSNLIIQNHSLRFMLYKQGIIINQQQLKIYDLERIKEALLKGNYTQNEGFNENKSMEQTNVQVVQR